VSTPLTPEDRQAIEALSVEWAWRLDHARWREVLELMTEDAVINLFGVDMSPADFGAWADERATRPERRTQHQVTNLRMRAVAERSASGHASLVLRAVDADRREPAVEFVGEYRDEYRRTADGWRIYRRRLVPLGTDAD